MSEPIRFSIRPVENEDREWILDLINASWGNGPVVVHQELFYPHRLPGFLAYLTKTQLIGLVTYRISGEVCEVVTLKSLVENQGVGTSLLESVAAEAKECGCRYVILTTTNANQRPIDFYGERGFRLKEIRQGAVDQAREIKPSIPRFSPQGTLIRDEWEFIKVL